ncbi:MAG: DUF1801 domain-containing protein [Chloracidobacterium sp.]|nr:DUF1801 domain-containing protein [Chloracidobacterium sp.]
MKSQSKVAGEVASKLISERIEELGDWRGDTPARLRHLHRRIVQVGGEALTFLKGASLKDPANLFNSSFDGNVRRAIDIHDVEEIDANAFKALIRAAVALNTSGVKKSTKRK